MKTFTVPADLTGADPKNPQNIVSFSFAQNAASRWANAKDIVTDMMTLLRWGKVVEKITSAKAGDIITLDDKDHELLERAADTTLVDLMRQAPMAAIELLPFVNAVKEAANA